MASCITVDEQLQLTDADVFPMQAMLSEASFFS